MAWQHNCVQYLYFPFMKLYYSPRVLIVDDEADTCYLLLNILKNKHISARCINSLMNAAEIVKKEEPGIVFLDNHLQDGNGIEFIKKLKEYSPMSKVIIITAQDNIANRKTAMQNGADYFISKPFTKDKIFKTINLFNL